jgi:hypothetical protein
MKALIEVEDCLNCPFRKSHLALGECWDYCGHDRAPDVYDDIICACGEPFVSTPDWCPLKEEQ